MSENQNNQNTQGQGGQNNPNSRQPNTGIDQNQKNQDMEYGSQETGGQGNIQPKSNQGTEGGKGYGPTHSRSDNQGMDQNYNRGKIGAGFGGINNPDDIGSEEEDEDDVNNEII